MPKKVNSKKNKQDKSLLGKNSIFTPDVINDIHINPCVLNLRDFVSLQKPTLTFTLHLKFIFN